MMIERERERMYAGVKEREIISAKEQEAVRMKGGRNR